MLQWGATEINPTNQPIKFYKIRPSVLWLLQLADERKEGRIEAVCRVAKTPNKVADKRTYKMRRYQNAM
jgi:hypothetical protein